MALTVEEDLRQACDTTLVENREHPGMYGAVAQGIGETKCRMAGMMQAARHRCTVLVDLNSSIRNFDPTTRSDMLVLFVASGRMGFRS